MIFALNLLFNNCVSVHFFCGSVYARVNLIRLSAYNLQKIKKSGLSLRNGGLNSSEEF